MSILRSFSNRVIGGIFLPQRSKPSLRFGGLMLKEAKSFSNYGIHGRSIRQLSKSTLCANEPERLNGPARQKRPREQDQSLKIIWTNEHAKILLGLFIEHVPNGGRNMLNGGKDSWCRIVDKFNELTGLECDYEYLYTWFKYYEQKYEIVNGIRHHPKFSWDHQRQKVIATDADWNEYIKKHPNAELYRIEIPYFDLLEKLFGDK